MKLNIIEEVFNNHYECHRNINVDFIKREAGHVEQVSSDYQGRVLYELIQNAFDRADKYIVVKVKDNKLYVANDGKKFTYSSQHDYQHGKSNDGKKFLRCDFQSLCSISTSNKSANESIGNKGVGFKSVYSLGRYADIHTKGIINPHSDKVEGNISFRLYDIFNDPNNLPELLNDNHEYLSEIIKGIHSEFPGRGVPGYYFPLLLNQDACNVFNSFDERVVTIIEVPITIDITNISALFDEIRKIHFEFVALKYEKDFKLEFQNEIENDVFIKEVKRCSKKLFTKELGSDIINIAKQAGIDIKEPKIAIKFREIVEDDNSALFYNYLPTKKKSPFKYVDLHADFHTTVDRKDINFDGDKVGAYNRELLKECVNLYFDALSSFNMKDDFDWCYLEVNDSNMIFYDVIHKLQIQNRGWDYASDFLADLAKKYFDIDIEREDEDYKVFFKYIINFINCFPSDNRNARDKYKWIEYFKKNFISKIKTKKVQVIPNIDLENDVTIYYKENLDSNVYIPSDIKIKITNFKVDDYIFSSALGIKDYNNSDELLKHFKQCSFVGIVNESSIAEDEQVKILNSVYSLFKSKNRQDYLFSHRYIKAFTKESRDSNSLVNQVGFNISTLFLKLKTGKYKPAQLCEKSELDLVFLSFIDNDDLDKWLKFLGVSLVNNYKIVDINLYNALNNGIDYIPSLYISNSDTITAELVKNIRVLYSNKELVHPALINDNNYRFLKSFVVLKDLREEFDNILVKQYQKFPNEYTDILKECIEINLSKHKQEIIRFYQNVFNVFVKRGDYLIMLDNQLQWACGRKFSLLGSKSDFELCCNNFPNEAILAYYSGKSDLPPHLKVIKPEKGDITFFKKEEDNALKDRIKEKIYYILLTLSNSNHTSLDFLAEDSKLDELQQRFESLSIYQCEYLYQELQYGDIGSDKSSRSYVVDNDHPNLYLSNLSTTTQKTKGICEFLFSNTSVSDQIELILFHKKDMELIKEYDKTELELIKRKWKPDYEEKFNEFQLKVLEPYLIQIGDNLNWYRYDENNRFLIELSENDKIDELQIRINTIKENYGDYFENFDLIIDYIHINHLFVKLKSYFDSNQYEEELNTVFLSLAERVNKKQLGLENELKSLLEKVSSINIVHEQNNEISAEEVHKLERTQEIENIYKKINNGNKTIYDINLGNDEIASSIINPLTRKIFFNGEWSSTSSNSELEITGATGEVDVLILLIKEFIFLNKDERENALRSIIEELKKHLRDTTVFDGYADECINNLNDDDKLSKSLISLFYIAREYKYANFDLIGYRNGKPTIIEVKTTKNRVSSRFFISKAEIETALKYENYELVRVTNDSIYFMGNPFNKIKDNYVELEVNGLKLTPQKYEVNIAMELVGN